MPLRLPSRRLVALLCELYEGAAPEAVLGLEPTLFDDLGIVRMVSPTRLAGLVTRRNCLEPKLVRAFHIADQQRVHGLPRGGKEPDARCAHVMCEQLECT